MERAGLTDIDGESAREREESKGQSSLLTLEREPLSVPTFRETLTKVAARPGADHCGDAAPVRAAASDRQRKIDEQAQDRNGADDREIRR